MNGKFNFLKPKFNFSSTFDEETLKTMINKIFNSLWPVICMIMLVHVIGETVSNMDSFHFLWLFIWIVNCAIYVPIIKKRG